jgi:2-oxo-4-hydroxy-4-carboxy-5-ureidoimidazoline decarboxylase
VHIRVAASQGGSRVTLADANTCSRERFVETLGGVFEDSPWVAKLAWDRRPFASVEVLHAAMCQVVTGASESQKLALLRAHPELGARARMSAASAGEQSAAGLDRLTQEQYENLLGWTAEYRRLYGFPFIYAVKGSTVDDIMCALSVRLDSTRDQELAQALWEVNRIAWFRLEQIFAAR